MRFRSAFAILLGVTFAGPLAAQESGNFVVRLGSDTTAVEHYTRTATRLLVDQVGRVPRVSRRHYTFEFGHDGAVARMTTVTQAPGAAAGAPPMQRIDATADGDSMRIEVRRDTSVSRSSAGVPHGAIVISNQSPWSMYERQTVRLAAGKADSLRAPLYFLGAGVMNTLTVKRLGRDSMSIDTEHDLYHARVDRKGMIQNIVPIRGTGKFTVDRVAALDLPGAAASFAAREQQAGAMGALSTRDTVRATVAGATLWLDYGRPAKRGRVVFGGVVPYGEVWRTGANAATQFRTDKALAFGSVTVPAGFYTLWTIPSPTGWKLVINSETGQWGTEHKADKDLATIDLTTSTLPDPVERFTISIVPSDAGGTVHLDWDTTRASAPFTVTP